MSYQYLVNTLVFAQQLQRWAARVPPKGTLRFWVDEYENLSVSLREGHATQSVLVGPFEGYVHASQVPLVDRFIRDVVAGGSRGLRSYMMVLDADPPNRPLLGAPMRGQFRVPPIMGGTFGALEGRDGAISVLRPSSEEDPAEIMKDNTPKEDTAVNTYTPMSPQELADLRAEVDMSLVDPNYMITTVYYVGPLEGLLQREPHE